MPRGCQAQMHCYLLYEQMQFPSWNLSLEFHDGLIYAPLLFRQEKQDPNEYDLLWNSPEKNKI